MPTRQVCDGYQRLVFKVLVVACKDALDVSDKERAAEARSWLIGNGLTLAVYLNLDHSLLRWLAKLSPI